jgi:hypothetical protein
MEVDVLVKKLARGESLPELPAKTGDQPSTESNAL